MKKEMKHYVSILCTLFAVNSLQAGEVKKEIKLNAPDKTRGTVFMKTIQERQSSREFSAKELSLQDLSDLLWTANGINRPESGKRTAPSALNKQEIDIYVLFPSGAYRYDAGTHTLKLVTTGDHRAAVAGQQDFVLQAPVSLVLVADLSRFDMENSEQLRLMAAVDAGIVSQNINLFCAATGLATVPRASMDKEQLKRVLQLKDTQLPLMNNPVGYTKK